MKVKMRADIYPLPVIEEEFESDNEVAIAAWTASKREEMIDYMLLARRTIYSIVGIAGKPRDFKLYNVRRDEVDFIYE